MAGSAPDSHFSSASVLHSRFAVQGLDIQATQAQRAITLAIQNIRNPAAVGQIIMWFYRPQRLKIISLCFLAVKGKVAARIVSIIRAPIPFSVLLYSSRIILLICFKVFTNKLSRLKDYTLPGNVGNDDAVVPGAETTQPRRPVRRRYPVIPPASSTATEFNPVVECAYPEVVVIHVIRFNIWNYNAHSSLRHVYPCGKLAELSRSGGIYQRRRLPGSQA